MCIKRDIDNIILSYKAPIPKNYYPHDDINELPILSWRMASQLFYSNWINYYVYQESPYIIDQIGNYSQEGN